jgi:hypothetical protein
MSEKMEEEMNKEMTEEMAKMMNIGLGEREGLRCFSKPQELRVIEKQSVVMIESPSHEENSQIHQE